MRQNSWIDALFSNLILWFSVYRGDNLELQCQSLCALLKLPFPLKWGAGSTFHNSQNWGRQQCENLPLVQELSKRKNRAARGGGTHKSSITRRNKCPAPASSPRSCQQLSQQETAQRSPRPEWRDLSCAAWRQLEADITHSRWSTLSEPVPISWDMQTGWLRAALWTAQPLRTPYRIWREEKALTGLHIILNIVAHKMMQEHCHLPPKSQPHCTGWHKGKG